MRRECVEGGVEDRGQVKLKHGAKKAEIFSLTSLHTTIVDKEGVPKVLLLSVG